MEGEEGVGVEEEVRREGRGEEMRKERGGNKRGEREW